MEAQTRKWVTMKVRCDTTIRRKRKAKRTDYSVIIVVFPNRILALSENGHSNVARTSHDTGVAESQPENGNAVCNAFQFEFAASRSVYKK